MKHACLPGVDYVASYRGGSDIPEWSDIVADHTVAQSIDTKSTRARGNPYHGVPISDCFLRVSRLHACVSH